MNTISCGSSAHRRTVTDTTQNNGDSFCVLMDEYRYTVHVQREVRAPTHRMHTRTRAPTQHNTTHNTSLAFCAGMSLTHTERRQARAGGRVACEEACGER